MHGRTLKALVWVIRNGHRGPEVLLLRRNGRRGGGLHPVTGKAEPGEPIAAAAAREVLEETGIAGHVVDLGFRHQFRTPRGKVAEEHAFLLEAPAGADVRISDEHVAYEWAGPEEARRALAWDAHRKALELALEKFVPRQTG
jgi:8-oxo-dGTP pyrophosphatase MutT (NUDIX family)